MSIDIKAVFGFGTLLQDDQLPWYIEEFDEFDCDFLEWVSQQINHLPPGQIYHGSPEDIKRFASTFPVNFIQDFYSDER